MSRLTTDLSQYNNSWYRPGSKLKRGLWYICNLLFLNTYWFPFQGIKIAVLRMFGAKIGKQVVIKPKVNIKYPWLLHIGDYSWIGEQVWIDNLAEVSIGRHVCISQGALILSGNHNYTSPGFDLMLKPISIENGAWIGARATVVQGTQVKSHAVVTANSVASGELKAYGIYQGHPVQWIKERKIEASL